MGKLNILCNEFDPIGKLGRKVSLLFLSYFFYTKKTAQENYLDQFSEKICLDLSYRGNRKSAEPIYYTFPQSQPQFDGYYFLYK